MEAWKETLKDKPSMGVWDFLGGSNLLGQLRESLSKKGGVRIV